MSLTNGSEGVENENSKIRLVERKFPNTREKNAAWDKVHLTFLDTAHDRTPRAVFPNKWVIRRKV